MISTLTQLPFKLSLLQAERESDRQTDMLTVYKRSSALQLQQKSSVYSSEMSLSVILLCHFSTLICSISLTILLFVFYFHRTDSSGSHGNYDYKSNSIRNSTSAHPDPAAAYSASVAKPAGHSADNTGTYFISQKLYNSIFIL
jgi:hypothetical protein